MFPSEQQDLLCLDALELTFGDKISEQFASRWDENA
jgi:hypothetical protein